MLLIKNGRVIDPAGKSETLIVLLKMEKLKKYIQKEYYQQRQKQLQTR